MEEYYIPRKQLLSEPALWWILGVFIVIASAVFIIVGIDAYRLASQNKEFVLSGIPIDRGDGGGAAPRTQPLVYNNEFWKVSFEIPPDYALTERVVSEDEETEASIQRRVEQDIYADTTVRIWVGNDTGFNRYLLKPYTTYGGYRRITAVARRAVMYSDPSEEGSGIQVIAVDDSRNGREIRAYFSALHEGAESLALNLLQSMRLLARERGEDVLHKDGWRSFVHEPVRFQYPEDYSAERRADGTIVVRGAGGRIEIEPILDVLGSQTATRTFAGRTGGDQRIPDDFFDLRYDVTLRVKIFYAGTDDYQKTVLQDISRTISLKDR